MLYSVLQEYVMTEVIQQERKCVKLISKREKKTFAKSGMCVGQS